MATVTMLAQIAPPPRAPPVISQLSRVGVQRSRKASWIPRLRSCSRRLAFSSTLDNEDEDAVDDLRLPKEWSNSAAAAQESEWLRGSLKRWLDDEYYPEATNVEISKRCAAAYYRCLVEQELDAGNILMQMIQNLETLSFKESFHGAFSSANAAMELILKRMREEDC